MFSCAEKYTLQSTHCALVCYIYDTLVGNYISQYVTQKREWITPSDQDVQERDTPGKSETSQQWLNSSSAVPTFDVYQSTFPHPSLPHQNQILKKGLASHKNREGLLGNTYIQIQKDNAQKNSTHNPCKH